MEGGNRDGGGVPRRVFQAWFQGLDHLAAARPDLLENAAKWRSLNPTWRHEVVDAAELRRACAAHSPACRRAFDAAETLHQKIDLGRYALLWRRGGAYVDADAHALRGLESNATVAALTAAALTAAGPGHVVALSALPLAPAESALAFRGQLRAANNAVMLATARNPLLREFVARVARRVLTARRIGCGGAGFVRTMLSTGPEHVNDFFLREVPGSARLGALSRVVLLPPHVFEPCMRVGPGPRCACDVRPDTVALHCFENTWLPPGLTRAMELYAARVRPAAAAWPALLLLAAALFAATTR